MKRFKLFIKRFAESEDAVYVEVGVLAARNSKAESQKIISDLENIEKSVDGTVSSLENLPASGRVALHTLKAAIQDLLKSSKDLDAVMTKVGAGKTTPGFNKAKSELSNKNTLKEAKIGFTGGASTDQSQLLKEVQYLYAKITSEAKLLNNEEEKQVKIANQMIASLEKESAIKQQQSQTQQVKVDFQQSFTDIGGNAELTAQYREQYNALMALLTPEQQDVAIKKLMNEENKKLINSTVAEIQALKESATNSTKSVSGMDKLRAAMRRLDAASDTSKEKFKSFVAELRHAAVTWRIIGGVFKSVISTIGNMYENAAGYEEALNLYTVALGEYAQQATKWANTISEALYLDPKNIMQYTGAFYNLVSGLGATSDAAYLMATNLTQLSYDMSSYLNIDVEAAQAKIQSAITGQARAVASAGVAMQQASLQELAYSLGVEKAVSEMTQAEKTYLRYIQIIRSTTNMQGDLARTIITPANALRVIKTQFTLLGRAIGQVFIPIVLKVIPYVMLLVQALQKLAGWLARLTGYKIADIDYSSLQTADTYLEGLGDTAVDTAGKVKGAAASMNRSLAPFDNLNVVESESTGGGGTGGGGVGGPSVVGDLTPFLDGYDMLAGLTDRFNQELETAKQKIKDMMPLIITVGSLLLAWKLSTAFMNAIIFVDNFLKSWAAIKEIGIFAKIGTALSSIGGFIMSIPAIGEAAAAFSLIGDAIAEMVAGTMSLSEGFAFIGSALGPIAVALGGIAGVILGIITTVKGIKQIIQGDTLKGIFTTIEGIALAVAGISLLLGAIPVAIGAAIVAAVAAVVANWEIISAFFADLWNGMLEIATNIVNSIIEFFSPVVDWINDNLIKPVKKLISPLVPYFEAAFKSIWETVKSVIELVKSIFVNTFDLIFTVVSKVIGDVIEIIVGIATVVGTVLGKVWEIVSKIFEVIFTLIKVGIEQLWELAKKAINAVLDVIRPIATWIYNTLIQPVITKFLSFVTIMNEKVIQPVVNFFKDAVDKVYGFFKDLAVDISEAFSSTFKSVLNGAFTIVEDLLNGFIKGFNKVIDVINEIPGVDIRPIKKIELPRFEKGGYPDSGDLFFANENGKAEYITSIGNRTAVANQDQMIGALTNAILAGMGAIETNRSNGITQVYIGNEKVYDGYGTYQNRQADRYGTTYVKV